MKLEHVAVIGAGIMGGHLSSFFANLGITSDLFDVDRSIAEKTLQKMVEGTKIPSLYTPRFAKRIKPRSVAEFDRSLKNADMIIEVVPERMELKQKIFMDIDDR